MSASEAENFYGVDDKRGDRTLLDRQGHPRELAREPVGHLGGGGMVGGRGGIQGVLGVALVGLRGEGVHGLVGHDRQRAEDSVAWFDLYRRNVVRNRGFRPVGVYIAAVKRSGMARGVRAIIVRRMRGRGSSSWAA